MGERDDDIDASQLQRGEQGPCSRIVTRKIRVRQSPECCDGFPASMCTSACACPSLTSTTYVCVRFSLSFASIVPTADWCPREHDREDGGGCGGVEWSGVGRLAWSEQGCRIYHSSDGLHSVNCGRPSSQAPATHTYTKF